MTHQAQVIKKARAKSGLTQSDMARLLKITAQFLSNIENGKSNLPAKYAARLSGILRKEEIKRAYLLDCEETWLGEYKNK